MNIQPPYLLFIGDAQDELSIKIGQGIVDWRPELCIGEFRMDDCAVSTGVRCLTIPEAKDFGAATLIVGLSNPGGSLSKRWVPILVDALERGLDVACGLHERLTSIPEIREAATRNNCQLNDVRYSDLKLKTGTGIKRSGKRLLTVGTDCSVGKMYTSLALEKEMHARNIEAEFIATGQSGIFISGKGVAVDCVVADFISGAVEYISPDNEPEHWDIIEGQGSLLHPAFAGVSLGLLHGAQPDALVLCHAENHAHMRGIKSRKLPDIEETMSVNLQAAKLTNPAAKFVGISVNTSKLSENQGRQVCKKYEDKYQLPCADPFRSGVAPIVENIISTFTT